MRRWPLRMSPRTAAILRGVGRASPQCALHVPQAFAQQPAYPAVVPQSRNDRQLVVGGFPLSRPAQRRANVVELEVHALQPLQLVPTEHLRLRAPRERLEVRGVSFTKTFNLG